MNPKALVLVKHNELRFVLSKFLRSINVDPIEASSSNETYRKDINLVIANEILQNRNPNIPTIILTHSKKPDNDNVYYIEKPFDVTELQEKVRDLAMVVHS